ncbi:adenylate/guanylate cyclase domain-containing protein [Smaragdicoccus niigatensis]|uniref:adenylate/guanylate cyclase domain-containing protein n=1 Tax=Smaragdicoccus niigatensis TaxID=359359 RepID=UPI00036242A3|nr:adenylate/guanylate cyclase domain-containing protein [Smaragdicoccus niigatensis]
MADLNDPVMADIDLDVFAEAIETMLLGGSRTLTPRDLAEAAGLDRDDGRLLWQSMGFATVADDEVALTTADLEAAKRVRRAIDLGIASFDEVISLSRLTGQIFAQLADSEGESFLAMAAKQADARGFTATIEQLAKEILPFIEELHTYVWRRQLSAFVARKVANFARTAGSQPEATVGFADISGFTALSRQTADSDLATLLELFESVATTAVGAHNGRVVKLIGDAVLYTADDPGDGVYVALDMLDAWPVTQPPIRAGVASGPILRRLGDVFGSTVNIASRLTSLSQPREVRVDEMTSSTLSSDSRFEMQEQPPQDVRGYDQLRSWLVTPRT